MSANSSEMTDTDAIAEQTELIESHGAEYVTDEERDSTARDLFFVFLGSQFSLGIIIVGSLPIVFGLGWWDAVSAITIGLAIGSLVLTPISVLGVKSGVNGPVTSAAHFGVRGQVIGALINLLILTGFFTLAVWTGGEAIATGYASLSASEFGNNQYALGSAIICGLVILVALVGHKAIVATEKLISYVIGASLLAIMFALAPQFDASYTGGEYLMGSFWPTWMAAVSVCVSMPVSYSTVINDYTRYVPRKDSKKAALAAGSGMFIGCWIAFIFAAYMSTMFASADTLFVSGLFELVPAWGVLLLIFIGLVGSQPQGSLCLYGAGLTLQILGISNNRVTATLIISAIGLAIVFAGIYLVSMIDLILAFLTLIIVCASPWLAINCVGHFFVKKQDYDPVSFFAGNKGEYWYGNGWNMPAVTAWVAGVIAGLLFTATDVFTGPLADMTGGISLDYLVAYLVGGAAYLVLHPRPVS